MKRVLTIIGVILDVFAFLLCGKFLPNYNIPTSNIKMKRYKIIQERYYGRDVFVLCRRTFLFFGLIPHKMEPISYFNNVDDALDALIDLKDPYKARMLA